MSDQFGSSEAGKKGGRARADKLSPETRSDIARQAAETRWAKAREEVGDNLPIPRVTHGSADHPLTISNIEVPCYVLEGGIRVITNRGLQRALGMFESGGAQRLVNLVDRFGSKGIDTKDLAARMKQPIEFRPQRGGRAAFGYEATVLADICEVVLNARSEKALSTSYDHRLAEHCELLVRGFARIGLIALIDEATGYQEIRDRQALQEILDQYLRAEFASWAKRFPDEFYQEIFRLRGWVWRGMRVNRPHAVATYTKDLVYKRLAPGLLKELEERNPKNEKGYRRAKHHQWLTEDIGHPALAQHIYAIIGLMRASDTWGDFTRAINRAFPRRGDSLDLPLFDRDQDNS